MTDQHPITPPPELMQEWRTALPSGVFDGYKFPQREQLLCIQAARWGADQELEACCEWLKRDSGWDAIDIKDLIEYRRPKPQSLKEQAKFAAAVLRSPDETCSIAELQQHWHTICNALEALPDG